MLPDKCDRLGCYLDHNSFPLYICRKKHTQTHTQSHTLERKGSCYGLHSHNILSFLPKKQQTPSIHCHKRKLGKLSPWSLTHACALVCNGALCKGSTHPSAPMLWLFFFQREEGKLGLGPKRPGHSNAPFDKLGCINEKNRAAALLSSFSAARSVWPEYYLNN